MVNKTETVTLRLDKVTLDILDEAVQHKNDSCQLARYRRGLPKVTRSDLIRNAIEVAYLIPRKTQLIEQED